LSLIEKHFDDEDKEGSAFMVLISPKLRAIKSRAKRGGLENDVGGRKVPISRRAFGIFREEVLRCFTLLCIALLFFFFCVRA